MLLTRTYCKLMHKKRCDYYAKTHVTKKKYVKNYKIKCCVCEKVHNLWKKIYKKTKKRSNELCINFRSYRRNFRCKNNNTSLSTK